MADETKELETKETEEEEELFSTDDEGEIIVYPEEDTKDLNADSDEEQSDEDNLDDSGKEDETPDEFDEKYPHLKGKTREELAEINKEAQSKITKESTARATAEKLLEDKDLTFEEKLDRLSPKAIDEMVINERNRLLTFDEDDDEHASKISESKATIQILETAYSRNYTRDIAGQKLNDRFNEDFVPKMEAIFKEDGIEISTEEFGEVSESAKDYLEKGLLTVRSYQKAMLDKFGTERFSKFYETKGNEQARKDMSETKNKETKTTGTKGVRKSGVRYLDMGKAERKTYRESLSDEELQTLGDQLPKNF